MTTSVPPNQALQTDTTRCHAPMTPLPLSLIVGRQPAEVAEAQGSQNHSV